MKRIFVGFVLSLGVATVLVNVLLSARLVYFGAAEQVTIDGAETRRDAYRVPVETPSDTPTAIAALLSAHPRSEWRAEVGRVGKAWGRHDPLAAMDYAISSASMLPDDVRQSFIDRVTGEWALTDPEGFLAYAHTLQNVRDLKFGLLTATVVLPERVLALSAHHPSVEIGQGRTLEDAAIMAVAEREPSAALAYLDALPPGDRHRHLRGLVAEAWARTQPEEALSWAQDLRPAAPGVVATVIAHTAAIDVDLALNLLEYFDPPPDHLAVRAGVATPQAIARTIVGHLRSNEQRMEFADRLLYRRTPNSFAALGELATQWIRVDTTAAMDWIGEAYERIPPRILAQIATRFAADDAHAAAGFAERLPAEARPLWARQVLPHLAGRDAYATTSLLAQLQGHDEYETLYRTAIQSAALSHPERAAEMLSNTPTSLALPNAEIGVAMSWSMRDPVAAAAWAEGISDPARRLQATAVVAQTWAGLDPESAQRWVLALPAGESRESASMAILSRSVMGAYPIDPRLADSLPSAVDMQRGISDLILELAMRYPARAESLVPVLISDSELQDVTVSDIGRLRERYSLTIPE